MYFEAGNLLRDDVEVVAHLLCGHSWTKAVPRTPPGRWRRKPERRMIRVQPLRQRRQERLTIRSRRVRELLERPLLARFERQPFGFDDDLERRRPNVQRARESSARIEGEDVVRTFGCLDRGQPIDDACSRRLGQTVVFRVGVVAEIQRLAQRAPSLRQHLKALAIEGRVPWKRVSDVEQDDVLDAHRLTAGVGHGGLTGGASPRAGHLHVCERLAV